MFDYCADLQQDRLLRLGAVPRLVSVLLQYCENEPLLSSCLLALCNLAGMGEEDDSTFVWEKRGHFDEKVHVYHGSLQHSFSFVSAVAVVRLNRWSQGQYSVSVEVVHKCSTHLWKEQNRQWTEQRPLRLTLLRLFFKFYLAIKYSVKNIPKNSSHLKAAAFRTFLWEWIISQMCILSKNVPLRCLFEKKRIIKTRKLLILGKHLKEKMKWKGCGLPGPKQQGYRDISICLSAMFPVKSESVQT